MRFLEPCPGSTRPNLRPAPGVPVIEAPDVEEDDLRNPVRHWWEAWHMHPVCRGIRQVLLAVLCLSAEAPRGWAATATAGYDYYAGPGGQVTHGPLGALTFSGQRTSLTVGAVRYDDNQVGPG